MTHVRLLQHCPGLPGVPNIQPRLYLVRSPGDLVLGDAADRSNRMHQAQARKPCNVAKARPQRVRDSSTGFNGGGYSADWPGREFGVRSPTPDETPLSWSEVNVFLHIGALNG